MERLQERVDLAQRALETLRKLPLDQPVDDVTRGAAIQRFEYTLEAVWKAAQLFLRETEGIMANSLKAVVRTSFRAGLIDEAQTRLGLQMVDDRNLTAHTYNEALAQAIIFPSARLGRAYESLASSNKGEGGTW